MTEIDSFAAETREGGGKGPARALRRIGRIPAVVYGDGQPQQMISLETRLLRRAVQSPRFYSTLFTLELGGKSMRVLPREVQLHPVSDEPIHADFIRVSRGASVTVEVPVAFLNEDESPGLKRGGVLNVVRREVEVTCPADAIPEAITIDLAEADIGDSLHFSSATLPAGVEPTITDRDFTIATISAPSVSVEEEEAAEAAEAEAEAEAAGEAVPEEGGEETA